jgi:hypothetical protein
MHAADQSADVIRTIVMQTSARGPRVILFAAAPAILAIACSASNPNSTSVTGGGGSATTVGGGGTTAMGGATGGGGDIGIGGIAGGGGAAGIGCSPDLQKVVDENGNVITDCPPDQGCFGGVCIPACEAAAQSKGSIGCDFWAPDPPFFMNNNGNSGHDGPCYAVFLANAWGRPAQITVSRGAQSFDLATFGRIPIGQGPSTTYDPIPPTGLPPGQVAVLFLSHKPGVSNFTSLECPVPPAILADAAIQSSGKGTAFHVLVDTPVSAYDILPYGGAKSYLPGATLLYPGTAWGTNYVGLAPHQSGAGAVWAMLVAAEDNTTLQVAPKTNLPGGGGIAPAPAGQATTYVLNRGEMIQWLDPAFGGPVDPTGAVFFSDKPVGLWTGNDYISVSSQTSPGGGGQDSAHQQIPHVKALGNEYVGAGIVTRMPSLQAESVPYRMVGTVDGTVLTFDPPSPAPGLPATIGQGQVLEFETTQAFSVRSQDSDHPFLFSQYMPGALIESRPGCSADAQFCGLGDEEWVTLVPPRQFLSRYIFFTDPTYATTNLVIVRQKGKEGFSDVNVACLGTVTGFQPIGASGMYEYAHVDLIRGNVPVVPACATSQHEATSKGAFSVTVWGTDSYASYGYPAGGNVGTINTVEVPPEPK